MKEKARWIIPILSVVATAWIAVAGPMYEVFLTVDFEAATFTGTMHIIYTDRTPDRLSEVLFRLLPNGGGIYGDASIDVSGVSVDGRPVEADLTAGGTALRVPLPTPLGPDESVVIDLEFTGEAARASDPGSSGYGVLTKSERALTLSAFYPILAVYDEKRGWNLDPVPTFGDALTADYASYEVTVTADADLGLAASGRLVDSTITATEGTYRFSLPGGRDFAIVVLAGYEMEEEVLGDFTIRSWFYPEDRSAASIARRLAIEALALYEGTIGDLPMSEIDIVEVPLHRAAGVESSGLILISSEYAKRPEDPFYDVIVSHEVAHQWFYNIVGNDTLEDPWLDEGLVSYLSYVFLEKTRRDAAAEEQRRGWEISYEAAQEEYDDLSVTAALSEFPDVSSYTSYVYSGGALLFDAIRRKIGNEAFFNALSDYYEANAGRIATPESLIAAFERACGHSLTRIFSRFADR